MVSPGNVIDSNVTAANETWYPYQRKIIFAFAPGQGWTYGWNWCLYSDGTNLVWRSSKDGITWGAKNNVPGPIACVDGRHFSVWATAAVGGAVPPYVYYARAESDTDNPVNQNSLYFCRGTLNSDGTIIWSAEVTIITAASGTSIMYPTITNDSSGYHVISYNLFVSPYTYSYVIRSTTTDNTWTTDSGWPFLIAGLAGGPITIVAMTSRHLMAVYFNSSQIYARYYDGSSWATVVAVTASNNLYFSVCAQGDLVGVVSNCQYQSPSKYEIIFNLWNGSWGANEVIDSLNTNTYTYYPVLTVDPSLDVWYVFYADGTNYVREIRRLFGTWESAGTIIANETTDTLYDFVLSSFWQVQNTVYLMVIYTTLTSGSGNHQLKDVILARALPYSGTFIENLAVPTP